MKKLVYGVGLYEKGEFTCSSKGAHTKEYRVWKGMLRRAYSTLFHKKVSTYIGCSVSEAFKNFQSFSKWYISQIGYGLENYDLDKDLLINNNKLYSEDTCVLIPHPLNSFLSYNRSFSQISHPGISLHKKDVYIVRISESGHVINLGYFKTLPEAQAAYKQAKETEARRWYDRLVAGEFVVDLRVIERMRTWEFVEKT